jgi:hypothetical protein
MSTAFTLATDPVITLTMAAASIGLPQKKLAGLAETNNPGLPGQRRRVTIRIYLIDLPSLKPGRLEVRLARSGPRRRR